ncbi:MULTISPECIES: catabolic alanine racemase DadX [Serratia]|uniref:catabolic alanine racemase DadX n=1 Tax=Serratia TaxID=613 RepID=UPI00077C0FA7|nr:MULTISPECIES: catabolic alanine racemase DadX [Serratia]CAI0731428.1 Alanine racemase, catabolic [Serratia ficaria]CAI0775050.1 Alanine racemase, catabolic [Serratia ficaria]CAI0776182.1 Alanine racemase, catabolic [Serratia ficaria]CAI1629577.1 Alanine racemase, catabolic [Serratia ficaria]CAI1642025.1 Alanine racemase, catabolic [Serratia ficaria]
MPRPISATLHLGAIANNLQVVRRFAPDAKVWSVVKANAYGHGIARVWRSLAQTDGFAMLDLAEAVLLRESGWQGPILLLEGFFQPQDLALLDRYRLTTAVHSDWQLAAIAEARLSAPLEVYLKVNSGMNRLGFAPERLHGVWQQAQGIANIAGMTVMSHFATADGPEGVQQQMATIENAAAAIPLPRCLANSAATLWHPDTHGGWVRPGIVLYGASPSGRWRDIAASGLQPAMTLSSEIIGIQRLKSGDRVGYGGRYGATGAQRIGVVACGYADGYPRHAPTGTPVWVGGVLTRTLGTVSMDMLAVDLAPCPQAELGTEVELWGRRLPVDDVATAAGTLGYELLTALAARVPVASEI